MTTPMPLSPGDNGGVSTDMNARKSIDGRLAPEPISSYKSYAHRWELPPVVEERIRSSLLMHETIASNVSTLPSYARDLGAQSKNLARRVVWDTDRDLIFSDEIIHGSAMLQNMRTQIPPDVLNIKVQYFRKSEGTDPGNQTGDSDPDSSEIGSEMMSACESSDQELVPISQELIDKPTRLGRKRIAKQQRKETGKT